MSPRLNPLVHVVSHKSTPLILGPRPSAPLVLDTTVGVVAGPVLRKGTTYRITMWYAPKLSFSTESCQRKLTGAPVPTTT